MRDRSGRPFDELPVVSPMSPPITIVCPDCTLTIVCTERVLIGGASPGLRTGPGSLTSACTSSVMSPPALMCGVTCSSTPVSMYCDVVVTTLVVVLLPLPTKLCWLIGILLPALIVAFWLSSAARCGFATTLVSP